MVRHNAVFFKIVSSAHKCNISQMPIQHIQLNSVTFFLYSVDLDQGLSCWFTLKKLTYAESSCVPSALDKTVWKYFLVAGI